MQVAHPFRKAYSEASAADAFTARTPTTTKPSGSGIFDLVDTDAGLGIGTGAWVPEFLQLVPYGTDANDEAFDLRLIGWSKTTDSTPVWVPQTLATLAVTLGNIAATALEASAFLADTIVVTKGADEESGYGASTITNANDTPASILIGLRGCPLIEFQTDIGTAAKANCLWRAVQNTDK